MREMPAASSDLDARLSRYEVTAAPVTDDARPHLRLVWMRPTPEPLLGVGVGVGVGGDEVVTADGTIALLDAYRVTRVPTHGAAVRRAVAG